MMAAKEIVIREPAALARTDEFVRVAVPWAKGELSPDAALNVFDLDGHAHPCQTRILKQWPDGSVKWLLADFVVTVPAGSSTIYRLAISGKLSPLPSAAISVTQGADVWQVDTGAGIFSIDARTFRPFTQVTGKDGRVIARHAGSCSLSLNEATALEPVIDDIRVEDRGHLRTIIRMAGYFDLPNGERARFVSRLNFFAASLTTQIEFTLHNPRQATHPGGLWDLGDPGSLLFKDMSFTIPLAPEDVAEICCIAEPSAKPMVAAGDTNFSIYQESSGGQNWQSPNHRNRNGTVPLSRKGYLVEVNADELASGLRATPLVWCGRDQCGVSVALPRFWQEFPKAIDVEQHRLRIALFPGRFSDLHELQGGEQKTHSLLLDFAAKPDSLAWALSPLKAMASSDAYRASGVFGDLPGTDDLIDRFTSPLQMCQKRELLDEYGWRNFGELYADHEAVFHQGEQTFVSHYNNQYDFCAGAYRKFFATGDHTWGELAADLARHIRDIDLYHTDQDREEYNHGLFWHTDHYVDAGLATHRSFSREQLGAKDPRFCGGGPGAEQCYTTGLLLHYFQTGNPDFKDAVISLAEWELIALGGSPTILATLKRSIDYLSRWRSVGGHRQLFPRYPLTRGTGNAVTACIDAFEAGGGRHFLDRAGELIRGALHPGDDIAARNLLDAETAWSYTVLLVAVAKFLDKKSELGECDDAFDHARAGLLAYVTWMLEHEYPYLDRPEILEFPNETWAAQDLRKSVVFFQAARYAASLEQRQAFLEKARFFFGYAGRELGRHATSTLTRPVVLMLQNGWVGNRLSGELSERILSIDERPSVRPTPYLTVGAVLSRIVSEAVRALQQTSFKRELAWFKARLG